MEEATERYKTTRSIFAQNSIKVDEIEQDLKETDEAIGNPEAVKNFVFESVRQLKAQIKEYKEGYLLYTTNLPYVFKSIFNKKDEVRISFYSPTPEGYEYIGRNHPFVEQLCQFVMNNALMENVREKVIARTSVVTTDKVDIKTSIYQLRVRNIISEKDGAKQIVTEEMILWGYSGEIKDGKFLSQLEAESFLESVYPLYDLTKQRQESIIENEINSIGNLDNILREVVRERSEKLIAAHERFRKLMGGSRYKIVEPVLPPDILGIYILLPKV